MAKAKQVGETLSVQTHISDLKQAARGQKAPVHQLPLWRDHERALPNDIARSALFRSNSPRKPRESLEQAPIFTTGNATMTYTGIELRQDDEDTWLAVVHLAKDYPLGSEVRVSPYHLKKELRYNRSSKDTKRLHKSLMRLRSGVVTIHSSQLRGGKTFNLIKEFSYEDDEGGQLREWRIQLQPELHAVYGQYYYSLLGWEQRHRLKPLGKWLQGYYASHKEPQPVSVTTIHSASGSEAKHMRSFRQTLKINLNDLVDIGFLSSWEIDDQDRVHVVRTGKRFPQGQPES